MNYKFKDILVGFRRGYLEIKKEIDDIEKNIKILDSELNKYKVLLNSDNSNLVVYFFDKEKSIIAALINIENKLGIPVYNLENLNYDSSIDDFYHFKNDIKHFHVAILNLKEFNNKIQRILESEFTKMMQKDNITTNYKDNSYLLEYDYNHLSQEITDGNSNLSNIIYYPNKDLIKFSYLGNLDNNLLNKELNVLYDRTLFNDYQRSLIDDEKKDIVLYNKDRTSEFNIIEEDKRLVLIKR